MIRMAELAPKGVFEDEEFFMLALTAPEPAPYERRFDDYSHNCDDAA
ncbi:MAG: hypothetical protein RSC00_01315 [Ruthenibacterium sp.]